MKLIMLSILDSFVEGSSELFEEYNTPRVIKFISAIICVFFFWFIVLGLIATGRAFKDMNSYLAYLFYVLAIFVFVIQFMKFLYVYLDKLKK